jgi:hypothetical protein
MSSFKDGGLNIQAHRYADGWAAICRRPVRTIWSVEVRGLATKKEAVDLCRRALESLGFGRRDHR